jgi:opacity protein-like surface antigen
MSNIVAQNNDPIVKTEFREYRFGITALSSLGWLTPLQQKIYSRAKIGLGFGWGFTVEKNFNPNTSIRTGFSISTFKAGLNYYDDNLSLNHKTYYVLDAQEEFVNWSPNTSPPNGELYQLINRTYRINYFNIPFILKLKTNEIGYFTYYGEFGASIGIKTKALVEDDIIAMNFDASDSTISNILNTDNSSSKKDIDIKKGTKTVRLGLSLGAGAEYNLSGNTSLFFQLNWNYFLLDQLKSADKEKFLRKETSEASGIFESVGAKSIPGTIVLSFGILF